MAKKSKRSSGAVAKSWEIFSKHPKAERKDVIALAVKAGINVHTAKTQYQRWQRQRRTPEPAPSTGNPPGPDGGG